jgi:hypothetical protein
MTIEEIIENSDIGEKEKDALLKQLEESNRINKTIELTNTLTSELVKLIRRHIETLDKDETLYYDKISIYIQSVLSLIRAVTPYHGHID